MTQTSAPAIDYSALIQDWSVHSRLYYDPAIFDQEMEKIWYREWVFVGHASEVPHLGDVLAKRIGVRQVFLTRAADGEVLVSQDDAGTMPIARVATYRGFVFGSFSPSGPTLSEHLGNAQPYLDQFVDLSPAGEIEVRSGVQKIRIHANWKMQLENSVDNYHGNFVHEFNTTLLRRMGAIRTNFSSDRSSAVTRDLGNGHTQLDFRPEIRKVGTPQVSGVADPVSETARRAYLEAMERRWGKQKAQQVIRDGSPHVMVFPNLFLIHSDLRIIQPIGVRKTYLYHYVALLKGAPPEINTHRLRRHEQAYGPAGFILPDDVDIFERNQLALEARANEWMVLKRGLHRERLDENGMPIGHLTDELTQRAIWRHYQKLMTRP